MAAILAIEADHDRRVLLRTLLRNRVEAHVTIVESAQAAIAYLSVCDVDVIVVPALLPPRDSDQLNSHVRLNAGRHVQMVTIPALDVLRELPTEESQAPGLFGRRRPPHFGLQYDPAMVAGQIADRLEHAVKMRAEQRGPSVGSPAATPAAAFTDPVRRPASPPTGAFAGDRRFAPRMRRDDVPWLWSIRLPWGTDVELVNISTSGLLVESDSKVSSGISLELRLRGPSLNRVVLARFVRCTISAVDRGRVRYYAAAQFAQPFDSPLSQTQTMARATPLSLAELLTAVLSDSARTEAASVRFARGLRELLGARDVLIRRGPLTPVEDSDTLYFEVREGGSCTVLQVTCEKHRPRTADDVKVMRAAAGMAAALIHIEPPTPVSSRPPILNWRPDTRPKNVEPV